MDKREFDNKEQDQIVLEKHTEKHAKVINSPFYSASESISWNEKNSPYYNYRTNCDEEEVIVPMSNNFFVRNKNYLLLFVVQITALLFGLIASNVYIKIDSTVEFDFYLLTVITMLFMSVFNGGILLYIVLSEATGLHKAWCIIISVLTCFLTYLPGAILTISMIITAIIMLFVSKKLINKTVKKRRQLRNKIMLCTIGACGVLVVSMIIMFGVMHSNIKTEYLEQCGYEPETAEYQVLEKYYERVKDRDITGLKVYSIYGDNANFFLGEIDGEYLSADYIPTEIGGIISYSAGYTYFSWLDQEGIIVDYLSYISMYKNGEKLSMAIAFDGREMDELVEYYGIKHHETGELYYPFPAKLHYSGVKLTDKDGVEYPFLVNSKDTYKMYCIDNTYIDDDFAVYFELDGKRELLIDMKHIKKQFQILDDMRE